MCLTRAQQLQICVKATFLLPQPPSWLAEAMQAQLVTIQPSSCLYNIPDLRA
jgi:hypothetical protein